MLDLGSGRSSASEDTGAERKGEERLVLLKEASADGLVELFREEALQNAKASAVPRLLKKAKRRSSRSSAFGLVSMAIVKSFWNHCRLYLDVKTCQDLAWSTQVYSKPTGRPNRAALAVAMLVHGVNVRELHDASGVFFNLKGPKG